MRRMRRAPLPHVLSPFYFRSVALLSCRRAGSLARNPRRVFQLTRHSFPRWTVAVQRGP